MKKFLLILFGLCVLQIKAQVFLNGNFLLGTTAWGCSPETNAETTYGGSNGLNTVAEVDAAAGLCQTVIGLGIGNVYTLSYQCSRRVGGCASPNPTNMIVTVSGGALSRVDTRTNTTFALTTTSYNFVALSNSHVITFAAGAGFGGSTCGMIVDNISITLFSPLPIELLYFNAEVFEEKTVNLNWETASELNNDYFTVERSSNSLDWEVVAKIDGAGTSHQNLKYSYTDQFPLNGISYYRLKQTDFDGTHKYAATQSVELNKQNVFAIYPNPNKEKLLHVSGGDKTNYMLQIYDQLGQLVFSDENASGTIDLNRLGTGTFYVRISNETEILYKNVLILQ